MRLPRTPREWLVLAGFVVVALVVLAGFLQLARAYVVADGVRPVPASHLEDRDVI